MHFYISSLYCESQFSTLGETCASGTERSGCGIAAAADLASSVAVTTLILDSGGGPLWCVADTVKIARSDRLRSARMAAAGMRLIFTTRLAPLLPFVKFLNEELHAIAVLKNHCGRRGVAGGGERDAALEREEQF